MGNTQLQAGQTAPNFSAASVTGETVDLGNYRGKKVWLTFFRHAHCPFCHIRLQEMRENYNVIGPEKLQIIAVFQSPASSFTSKTVQDFAWYPLVSDPEEKLYSLYGLTSGLVGFLSPSNVLALARAAKQGLLSADALKIEGTATRYPASFLIDPDGKIATAHYGNNISDDIPFSTVVKFAMAPSADAEAPVLKAEHRL